MKFNEVTDFHDFGLKTLPRTLVFEASGASGENELFFMIVVIFYEKIFFDDEKWKKSEK